MQLQTLNNNERNNNNNKHNTINTNVIDVQKWEMWWKFTACHSSTNYWPNFHADIPQKWVQEQTIVGEWRQDRGRGKEGKRVAVQWVQMHNWVNLTCSCRSNSWRLRSLAIFGNGVKRGRATGRMNVNVLNLLSDVCNGFSWLCGPDRDRNRDRGEGQSDK